MNLVTTFLVFACVLAGLAIGDWVNPYLTQVFFAAVFVIGLSLKMVNAWQKFVILRCRFATVLFLEALQPAMSHQTQAERGEQVQVILRSAEAAIAGKFVEVANIIYAGHHAALQLHAMNIIYETKQDTRLRKNVEP